MQLPPDEQRQQEEQRAKARFLIINVARVFGVIMVLMGMAIIMGKIALPPVAAYILIALGLVEAFVMPTILARQWNTNNRNPPRT